MATSFPTSLDLLSSLAELRGVRNDDGRWKVEVYHYPEDSKALVLVKLDYHERFRKNIDLRPKWWSSKSPRLKLLEAEDKAQRIARDLNWEMDKSTHEFESTRR